MQPARPGDLARLGVEDRCRSRRGYEQVAKSRDLPTRSERFTAYTCEPPIFLRILKNIWSA